ncbi:hypothetical protein ACIPW9_36490 [Streptomyces sp. NPDC090052]|uniref:hypothetical protein n=1 Tax=Streptomyces sp. NPDC090052 TaxID=3365931 RepID=UPI00380EE97F
MTTNHADWLCPSDPFGHQWAADKQHCTGCDHVRSASEAVLSILSGSRGCSAASARTLLDALTGAARPSRAEVLREVADDWAAHCFHHSDTDVAFLDCPCDWVHELRRAADEADANASRHSTITTEEN